MTIKTEPTKTTNKQVLRLTFSTQPNKSSLAYKESFLTATNDDNDEEFLSTISNEDEPEFLSAISDEDEPELLSAIDKLKELEKTSRWGILREQASDFYNIFAKLKDQYNEIFSRNIEEIQQEEASAIRLQQIKEDAVFARQLKIEQDRAPARQMQQDEALARRLQLEQDQPHVVQPNTRQIYN